MEDRKQRGLLLDAGPAANGPGAHAARHAGCCASPPRAPSTTASRTLIGRLLYDSKPIFEDQLEHDRRGLERRRGDGTIDLALLTDGLRAEREQGITIDVAYRYFATPRRKFIIADTPGHVQLHAQHGHGRVDRGPRDDPGRRAQRRRRADAPPRVHRVAAAASRTSSSCVNKMDLVDYDEARLRRDRRGVHATSRPSSRSPTSRSSRSRRSTATTSSTAATNMPWYEGPPLLLPPRARPHRLGPQPDRRRASRCSG